MFSTHATFVSINYIFILFWLCFSTMVVHLSWTSNENKICSRELNICFFITCIDILWQHGHGNLNPLLHRTMTDRDIPSCWAQHIAHIIWRYTGVILSILKGKNYFPYTTTLRVISIFPCVIIATVSIFLIHYVSHSSGCHYCANFSCQFLCPWMLIRKC